MSGSDAHAGSGFSTGVLISYSCGGGGGGDVDLLAGGGLVVVVVVVVVVSTMARAARLSGVDGRALLLMSSLYRFATRRDVGEFDAYAHCFLGDAMGDVASTAGVSVACWLSPSCFCL